MPNLFAHLVLYSYPLVVMVMFQKMPRVQALIWSMVIGYLFLPVQTGIDLPLLPELNKALIPGLAAAFMLWWMPETAGPRHPSGTTRTATARPEKRKAIPEPKSKLATLCLIALFLGPIGIYLTNTDRVPAGPFSIGGLRIYDIFSMLLNNGVMLLPFFLARRHLASVEAHHALAKALVIGGLIYAIPIMYEVRLSPQLNARMYGFNAHSYFQHIRAGGFRPMVFLEHGLRIGIFIAMSCLAALALYRNRKAGTQDGPTRDQRASRPTFIYLMLFVYLFFILYICKTVGALMIGLALSPVVLFLSARLQIWVAVGLAAIVLLYPMLRATNLFPVDRLYSIAQSIDEDRAQSLKFRFDNEDILLAKARIKPLLGWGEWGRSRIYDPETGADVSVTDGSWVLIFGEGGWVRAIGVLGLLALPAGLLLRRRGHPGVDIVTAGLTVVLSANLLDLIPNSSLSPMTWMLAGALLGAAEKVPSAVTGPVPRARQGHARPRAASSRPVAPRMSRGGQNKDNLHATDL